MSDTFTATSHITINTPAAKVWDALTNPAVIKQYLFGTEAISDWQVGSPLIYKGEWEGKPYEDKGTILAIEPEKLLEATYWSSFSGLPDSPENYQKVSYILESNGDQTTLTVTQDAIKTEAGRDQSQENWSGVLKSLKELLEK